MLNYLSSYIQYLIPVWPFFLVFSHSLSNTNAKHNKTLSRHARGPTSLSAGSQSARWGFAPPAAWPAAAARSRQSPPCPLLPRTLHPPQAALWGWEGAMACGCCSAECDFCSGGSHTRPERRRKGVSGGWSVIACNHCWFFLIFFADSGSEDAQRTHWMFWQHTDYTENDCITAHDISAEELQCLTHTHTLTRRRSVTLSLAVLGCMLVSYKAETESKEQSVQLRADCCCLRALINQNFSYSISDTRQTQFTPLQLHQP